MLENNSNLEDLLSDTVGCKEVFSVVFQQVRNKVDPDDVLDVTSDVMLDLTKMCFGDDPPIIRCIKGLIRRVARNRVADFYRGIELTRRCNTLSIDAKDFDLDEITSTHHEDNMFSDVMDYLSRCDPDSARIFHLYHLSGKKAKKLQQRFAFPVIRLCDDCEKQRR